MLRKPWMLVLPMIVLALVAAGPLVADEAPRPEAAPESLAPPAAPAVEAAPAEAPVPVEPLSQSDDCYSLSTCTPSFAACESWCYGQNCGINYWDPGPQICYCGTKF